MVIIHYPKLILMVTQEQISEKLLWPLWRCITEEYKSRYKRDVWDHFENAVRSAAYTGSLKTYLTNFQARIPTDIQAQYAKDILSIVNSGSDTEILEWLREETTYLTLQVRLMNQQRKEDYEFLNKESNENIHP